MFAKLTGFVCLFAYLQGLILAMVEHRYCVIKVDHKGLELKDALWRCAATTTVREFERCMQYIRDLNENAYEYLANIAPAQ